eukprot:TRINITY_DN5549_c0_g1_i2.p1 TRINITY_DN5549_c0_g1~~TRINITY_DN5549_c0_g1_i2.p1  ORF type:complete len:217 (-),score=16.86 TRINITY_DN5549_c0_g1_i2:155-805(-)
MASSSCTGAMSALIAPRTLQRLSFSSIPHDYSLSQPKAFSSPHPCCSSTSLPSSSTLFTHAHRIDQGRAAFYAGKTFHATSAPTHMYSRSQIYVACVAEEGSEGHIGPEPLTVPDRWLRDPMIASQESSWLQQNLHKWLDDEFCPEPPNVEISKRCAQVYARCLSEGTADLGDILLMMVQDLETFSFRNSFHGLFSSANAAVNLIAQRISSSPVRQ